MENILVDIQMIPGYKKRKKREWSSKFGLIKDPRPKYQLKFIVHTQNMMN